MHLFRNIFSKNKSPVFNLDQSVSEYLTKIPPCTDKIVITSSKHDKHYSCSVIVNAQDLIPWAKRHSNTWSSIQESNVAIKALPLWLQSYKVTNEQPLFIPQLMHETLEPYISDFIAKKMVTIYCNECHSLINDFTMEKLDEINVVDRFWWTDSWHCPEKHQIYYRKNEMRLLRRR